MSVFASFQKYAHSFGSYLLFKNLAHSFGTSALRALLSASQTPPSCMCGSCFAGIMIYKNNFRLQAAVSYFLYHDF